MDLIQSMTDVDLAEALRLYSQHDELAGIRGALLEAARRLRERPAPGQEDASKGTTFNEAVGLLAQHGFDIDLVREAAEIGAREGHAFIAAGLNLYAVAMRFGFKDTAVRIAIRDGWDAGMKAREKGGAS